MAVYAILRYEITMMGNLTAHRNGNSAVNFHKTIVSFLHEVVDEHYKFRAQDRKHLGLA